MNVIENKSYDEERALYNLKDAKVVKCIFAGPEDGESALKEARNIEVDNCRFSLRYPMWHDDNFTLTNSVLDEFTRAPLWYAKHGVMKNVKISSVKALRECQDIEIKDSDIDSREFGWKCDNIKLEDSKINSEYIFFDSSNIWINNLTFTGKYSFQYVNNLTITNSNLDTKDAFWHSKNVKVKNSIVKGEYLGWFSENLTLENCDIIGTQPLCYCTGLKLINCRMKDTDLAFEYSDVEASIIGNAGSIKNPKSGSIVADEIGEVIKEGSIMEDTCEIKIRNGKVN